MRVPLASLLRSGQAGSRPPRCPPPLGRLGRSIVIVTGLCGHHRIVKVRLRIACRGTLPMRNDRTFRLRTAHANASATTWSGIGPVPKALLASPIAERHDTADREPFAYDRPVVELPLEVAPLQAIWNATKRRRRTTSRPRGCGDWVRQNPYSRRKSLAEVDNFAWYDMAVGRRIPQLAYILDAGTAPQHQPAHSTLDFVALSL